MKTIFCSFFRPRTSPAVTSIWVKSWYGANILLPPTFQPSIRTHIRIRRL
jgi:hypothetical protein